MKGEEEERGEGCVGDGQRGREDGESRGGTAPS